MEGEQRACVCSHCIPLHCVHIVVTKFGDHRSLLIGRLARALPKIRSQHIDFVPMANWDRAGQWKAGGWYYHQRGDEVAPTPQAKEKARAVHWTQEAAQPAVPKAVRVKPAPPTPTTAQALVGEAGARRASTRPFTPAERWAQIRRERGQAPDQESSMRIASEAGEMPEAYHLIGWDERQGHEQDYSVLLVGTREAFLEAAGRTVSPFQLLHPAVSAMNALERTQAGDRLAFEPQDGVYFNLFAIKTLFQHKITIAIAMDYPNGVPHAFYDYDAFQALEQAEFGGFKVPEMGMVGPTYVDLRLWLVTKERGSTGPPKTQLMAEWILQGHKGDKSMSADKNLWYPDVVALTARADFTQNTHVKTTVNVFQGERVYSTTFSTGGRVYMCSRNGTVVRGGLPRLRLEIRTVNRSSPEALGEDGDIAEFSYVDAVNRLNVQCNQVTVNAESVRCSGAKGQALVRVVQGVRTVPGVRMDGPDVRLTTMQLHSLHRRWLDRTTEHTASRTKVALLKDPIDQFFLNFDCWRSWRQCDRGGRHWTAEVPLVLTDWVKVDAAALALGYDDASGTQEIVIRTDLTNAARPDQQKEGQRALTDHSAAAAAARPVIMEADDEEGSEESDGGEDDNEQPDYVIEARYPPGTFDPRKQRDVLDSEELQLQEVLQASAAQSQPRGDRPAASSSSAGPLPATVSAWDTAADQHQKTLETGSLASWEVGP